ncbi:IS630 transposase-related protein [Acinetobacter lanii]|uniref:Helix-turn-helix domain-containing protein n=3 Tax=Acinetobacter lanii TaxID=2715163 RepID=A0A6G8S4P9_9GAMM|nr:IS630 transposase-related protein [Acinetobacter lanii]QIO09104.1 helix-turn-helix domain-containing protein [Acinetobacter lanii]QIO09245.1 helix-turn-helix domain-containing protein [Acinetobacter lanii]
MPKTYSVDLREKAMQFYKESKHKSKTCEIFNIARTTLDDWILIEQQTGQLKQPKSPNVGRPSKILDLQAFEAFVKTTPFTQAKDLIPLFEQKFGYSVGYHVILKALNKMGWTRKKRVFSTNKPAS